MAGTSLLVLIDDIATLLDDISVLTKSAASKTVGVLGDDLALNAEQLTGVHPDRELPVVWAVAKGSAVNKLILVPSALAMSAFLPWLVTPVLMLGGAYLCYEGAEKVAHFLFPGKHEEPRPQAEMLKDPSFDLVQFEKAKIKGAILTDLILSGEIVIIALGSVQGETIGTQALVVSTISAGLTIGVYAIVAGIIKLDDAGLALSRPRPGKSQLWIGLGQGVLWFAPRLLKSLGILGTIAMFLVGGGIWVHGLAPLTRFEHGAEQAVDLWPQVGHFIGALVPTLFNAAVGVVLGFVALLLITQAMRLFRRPTQH